MELAGETLRRRKKTMAMKILNKNE